MNKFIILLKGELLRLKRYNLFAASLFVSVYVGSYTSFIDVEMSLA